MAQEPPESEVWFPPKRYGYGAGLPFTWQGWVLTLVYVLVAVGLGVWAKHHGGADAWLAAGGIVLATIVFLPLVRRHTRGGWRWRRDERD